MSKRDDHLLGRLADNQRWTFVSAGSWTEGLSVANKYRIAVILLHRNILGTDWKDALHLFLRPSHGSSVLLVTSTPVDHFCEAFIEEGGYGVILSPLAENQVIDMVQRAWSSWNDSVARPYEY
jgi:hypothetical protein